MNIYSLIRNWFNFCFDNPDKIKPNHTAIYVFAIEHCNRLGWKQKFGLPTTMVMEAIGIKSYNTYIKSFNELVEWGFIDLVEKSKNQYSSNIIALSNFDKALDSALDKALIKHMIKQRESTEQSIDSIDIQYNNTTNQRCDNGLPNQNSSNRQLTIRELHQAIISDKQMMEALTMTMKTGSLKKTEALATAFCNHLVSGGEKYKSEKDGKHHFRNWLTKPTAREIINQGKLVE